MKLTFTKFGIFIVIILINLTYFVSSEDPYDKIKKNLLKRKDPEVEKMGQSCIELFNKGKKDVSFSYEFVNVSLAYKVDEKNDGKTLLIFFGKNNTKNTENFEQFGGIYNGNAKNKKCYSVSVYYSKVI